jgi:hypothetical protein
MPVLTTVSDGAAPGSQLLRIISENRLLVNEKVREERREIVHLDKPIPWKYYSFIIPTPSRSSPGDLGNLADSVFAPCGLLFAPLTALTVISD